MLDELLHAGLAVAVPACGLLLLVPLTFALNSFALPRHVLAWLRPLRRPSLRGSVVVITGASSGIGEELALESARRGASLVLAARRVARLQAVAQRCQQLGAARVVVHPADVSQTEDCRRLVEAAVGNCGGVDLLVCNAGSAHSGLVADLAAALAEDPQAEARLRGTMDVDFWGNVWPTVFAMPHLRASRGAVLVTASAAAFLTFPRQALYNAAKSAVLQFYDTLRVELPPASGVTVTVALPGFVRSELTSSQEARSHIPWWWPMLPAAEAARIMLNAAQGRRRYVVVPFWYSSWLLYRVFASFIVDWSQRILLLGKFPIRIVKGLFSNSA